VVTDVFSSLSLLETHILIRGTCLGGGEEEGNEEGDDGVFSFFALLF